MSATKNIKCTYHEDVFYEYYTPTRHMSVPPSLFNGILMMAPASAAYPAVSRLPANNVWSVVTADNGRDTYFTPGFHVVNLEGYVYTQRAHNFEGVWFRSAWADNPLTSLGRAREIKKLETFLRYTAAYARLTQEREL